MSSNQKAALPTLQGQRIKARKRDEKEKFDPGAFRDSLLSGLSAILHHQDSPSDVPAALEGLTLEEDPNGTATPLPPPQITQDHLDALYKFLDTQGGTGKIDYRKYGESLFDILIAGGILGKELRFCIWLTIYLTFCFVILLISSGWHHSHGW